MAYNHLAKPDPELGPLLEFMPPASDSFTVDVVKTREYLKRSFIPFIREPLRSRLPPEGTLRVGEHQVPIEDGGQILVRCYSPVVNDPNATFPLLVWIHGGGYVFHSIETDDYSLRILAADLLLTVVGVEYRLAPEHPWPTPLDNSYAAVKWAAAQAATIHADLQKGFIVGGSSAGAHLSATIAHRAHADPFFDDYRKPTGQFLQIPATIHPDALPETKTKTHRCSRRSSCSPSTVCASPSRHTYIRMTYCYPEHVKAPPADPEFSPLLYPTESFKRLPAAYIQVCGLDPVRDSGMLYFTKLQDAGVPVKLDIYPGTPHGFHLLWPETEIAKKFEGDLRQGIKFLLAQS
ncbi:Alpha/Beta hydrolase protein [Trametes meyenii]|nr:Alpha/Beta hydrolase protein [Trametes meyenii]